jgi:anaphase-promoting complex subunit 6
MAAARRRLVKEYGMSDNPEVLLGFAETLFSEFRYADCFAITSRYAYEYDKSVLPRTTIFLH